MAIGSYQNLLFWNLFVQFQYCIDAFLNIWHTLILPQGFTTLFEIT